ncbi:MAG: ABC transporter substrate-binding protein, partial [Flavobacteriales bacterium]|nr:ABC transporter substrate-binding protein [Flavobacteriales bacterium]
RSYYKKVLKVETPDERTVTFHLDGTDRELVLILGLMPVLPKHYFAGRDFEATSLDPIPGTGPYQVDKLRVGESITWRRRDDYWGRDLPILQGHFNFDRIQYRYFRDKNTQFEAFKAGDHDMRFETDAGRWAREYTFPDVVSGRVMLHQIPVKRPVGMKAMVFNTRRTLFADARVREALGLALDFNFVNGNLLHGAFQRNTSFFQNSDLAARPGPAADGVRALLEPHLAELSPAVLDTPATPPVMTDRRARRRVLVQALKMLKSAGWKMGQDQVLERGDGQKLEFEILMYDPSDEAVAVNYAARLKRLGVRVSLRLVDAAQYERRRKNYDFDMIFNHWYQSLSPGSEQWYYWGRK